MSGMSGIVRRFCLFSILLLLLSSTLQQPRLSFFSMTPFVQSFAHAKEYGRSHPKTDEPTPSPYILLDSQEEAIDRREYGSCLK